MQIKDGKMRLIIETVRGKHEFDLKEIVSSSNYQEELPSLFQLTKEAYCLSKKEEEHTFQKLKRFQEAVDRLNQAALSENEKHESSVLQEKERHERAKESIAEEYKEEFKESFEELVKLVVPKYKPELVDLVVDNVIPLGGHVTIEASKAKNPEDLKKIDTVTVPFDAHEKPEEIKEENNNSIEWGNLEIL